MVGFALLRTGIQVVVIDVLLFCATSHAPGLQKIASAAADVAATKQHVLLTAVRDGMANTSRSGHGGLMRKASTRTSPASKLGMVADHALIQQNERAAFEIAPGGDARQMQASVPPAAPSQEAPLIVLRPAASELFADGRVVEIRQVGPPLHGFAAVSSSATGQLLSSVLVAQAATSGVRSKQPAPTVSGSSPSPVSSPVVTPVATAPPAAPTAAATAPPGPAVVPAAPAQVQTPLATAPQPQQGVVPSVMVGEVEHRISKTGLIALIVSVTTWAVYVSWLQAKHVWGCDRDRTDADKSEKDVTDIPRRVASSGLAAEVGRRRSDEPAPDSAEAGRRSSGERPRGSVQHGTLRSDEQSSSNDGNTEADAGAGGARRFYQRAQPVQPVAAAEAGA
eukprot:TRINITY_DN1740_c0_g1_i1.p1 TRINITY_DN1740_c0_g1~~TRINITY_DN1740_c0_g1_i1.p1  ORF type:complete len:394 (+),score=65.19 TRINITY_DN1740_c0_g1_i1:155-1336(+)